MFQEKRRAADDELGLQGVVELAAGYQRAQVLFAANGLGVFQALSAGPQTAGQLARALGVDARGLAPLLDACVALKVLRRGVGGYENSMTARLFLVPGREGGFGPVLRFWQQFSYGVWGRLEEAVRSGVPQTPSGPKDRDLFDDLLEDPARVSRLFFDGLAGLAYWPARKIAELAPLGGRRHLLDLGGGSGAFSAALARRHPHLRVTLFDLEPVCALARERFAAGLGDRVRAVAGDFHRGPLPEGVDCVLLSNVLHDWPPEACRALLDKVRQALAPGGEVLVYEVGAAGGQPPAGVSLFSLALLLDTNEGRVYGLDQVGGWLREAGFGPAEEWPVTDGTYLLRALKDPGGAA